jgi:hypothetical protein
VNLFSAREDLRRKGKPSPGYADEFLNEHSFSFCNTKLPLDKILGPGLQ